MRKLLLLFLGMLFSAQVSLAQLIEQPATWSHSVVHMEDNVYEMQFTATLRAPWHMYDLGPYENGPQATRFTFVLPAGVVLEGALHMQLPPEKKHDPLFDMLIGSFGGSGVFVQQVRLDGPGGVIEATVEWQACDGTSCLPPEEKTFEIQIGHAQAAVQPADAGELQTADTGELQPAQSGSLWGIILQAIAFGLVALVTPCVFPMVPMTVSFFLRSSDNKRKNRLNAALYGTFIVLLYTVPIAVIIGITYITGGASVTANIFNWLATHWIPNILFFLLFLVFAASFFGAFELALPARWTTKTDAKADSGGILGTFFLALTLVLVSFSCTGPIVGTVLIKSTQGAVWEPIVTMFAFSVAFALPFTILAFVPSLLQKLPKSGGWLNSVKVVLGFIVLAFSLKFLSTADQIYQWHLLNREVYLALWIVIFSLLGFYLLGKIRFKNDSPTEYVGVFRFGLAIAVFAFVVYMIPGMWGAPLKAISGFLPPIGTQEFVIDRPAPAPAAEAATFGEERKYSDLFSLPYGLEGFFHYGQAMDYAKEVGKPVFLDFTGLGCVNCKEMEARVWSDARVQQLLREAFVIVALHSDARATALPEDWVTDERGKELRTLGSINSWFMRTRFQVNAQPTYILLDNDGTPLVAPRSYDTDVDSYIRFLRAGLEAYSK
ncbi:MAG: thioredoxin fold domain-containing protein [Bacteroidales bacterium]|jgi:thiol:disulfide interchange protein|nr:cytochrome c biogenesis protein CcdA [Bacteroidales bacterium]NLK80248.1 thioredoxin fold domain-containing protein [Bacteroidales bacterium]HKM31821.1 cytochrome c biogenesis protein CcdA [Bacteroidales bacterium]